MQVGHLDTRGLPIQALSMDGRGWGPTENTVDRGSQLDEEDEEDEEDDEEEDDEEEDDEEEERRGGGEERRRRTRQLR